MVHAPDPRPDDDDREDAERAASAEAQTASGVPVAGVAAPQAPTATRRLEAQKPASPADTPRPIGLDRLRALREAIRNGTYPTNADVVGGLVRMFGEPDVQAEAEDEAC